MDGIATEGGATVDRPRRRTTPGAAPGTVISDPDAPPPRISVTAYGPDTITERADVSLDEALALREGRPPVFWLNVDGLGEAATIQAIGEAFGLHPLALEDVVNVHQRPKMDDYDDHLYIVTRMPGAAPGTGTEQVSLFLGDGFVLTFQERPGDCFDPVRERLRVTRSRIRGRGCDYLAYALLDAAIDAFFPVLDGFAEEIDRLEEEVTTDPKSEDVQHIHAVKRALQTIRRAIWPQREMLNLLIRDENRFFDERTQLYLRDCFDHTFQLIDLVETYREVAADLRDVYLSAQSTRLNEVMKVLTIIATIFLPLTLIAGVYGMNFNPEASLWNMPELGWAFGYPFALGLMLLVAGAMLAWFRRQGWLGGRARPPRRRFTIRRSGSRGSAPAR